MNSMRVFLLILFVVFFLSKGAFAQLSQGGKPLEPVSLKSAKVPVIVLPKIDNNTLLKNSLAEISESLQLKPFRFAEPVDVKLNPLNSGVWTTSDDGTQIWVLKIHSENAYSLNLIFDDFIIPEGNRLFLYNENKSSVLGAFTSFNNNLYSKFATLPVDGEEITVQYEIPHSAVKNRDFEIITVNHDFFGILKRNERRPFFPTIAGACNVDVNCGIGDKWSDIKDAVCRMFVNGRELCTGTLINNVEENHKPYIISAAHCYDTWIDPATTVYSFNYESPYCSPLDGDPSRAISGAVMKAQFDSLDFALVEMNLIPPPEYRPFYAGWDNSGVMVDTSVTIHHPWGDIKKISIDNDKPVFDDFSSRYKKNGFLKIERWEQGVTESGSSGGGLFNKNKLLIGTLTGGAATCSNPVRDYFARFDMAWNYRPEINKQLKYWLDPKNTGATKLNGNRFYEDEELCGAFTNLIDYDQHQLIELTENGSFEGYWGGTNNADVTEFMEKFSIDGDEQIQGISIGVGKIVDNLSGSEFTIKVYNGGSVPQTLIYSEKFKLKQLYSKAMNYLKFSQVVRPGTTFFIGFELSNMDPSDTLAIYQTIRPSSQENTFYYKKGNIWYNFKFASGNAFSIANVFELVACNIEIVNKVDSPLINKPIKILIYPNPTKSAVTLESGVEIFDNSISVYDILGKEVRVNFSRLADRKVMIDLSGNVPGIYFVRINNGTEIVTQKFTYFPW